MRPIFYSTTPGYISIKTNGQVYYSTILTYVLAPLYFKYTHTHIYMYICVCVCVCVCILNVKIVKIYVVLHLEIRWSGVI